MHILFLVDDFIGGAGNVIQILALEFREKGYDVSVILLQGNAKPRYKLEGINIISLHESNDKKKKNIQWLLKKIKIVKKVIKNEKPEIIISFLIGVNVITGFALIGSKIPFIASERSNPLEIQPTFFWKILSRIVYKRADKIVVQFDEFKKFDGGRYLEKTFAIPNPILASTIHKNEISDNRTIKIISLGNLRAIKGFDKLIRAFKIVSESHSNVQLCIFGEGQERANLEKLILNLNLKDKVQLKGYTDNIYEVLADSDIYVLSSEQEGFPNSLSEALAVGLPVVSFQCHNGLKELVEDGKNGYLVEPGNMSN